MLAEESREKVEQFFLDNSQGKNCIVDLLLFKNKEENEWSVYYGKIVITDRDVSDIRNFKEVDGNALAIRVTDIAENAKTFFGKLIEEDNGYFPIVSQGVSRLDIKTDFCFGDMSFLSFQRGHEIGLENPSNRLLLKVSNYNSVPEGVNLNKFDSFDDMILNSFDINLKNKHEGLQYALSFYVEEDFGKISAVLKRANALIIYFDFNESEEEKYECYFKDISPEESKLNKLEIRKNIANLDLNNQSILEIKLFKDKKRIDTHRYAVSDVDFENTRKNEEFEKVQKSKLGQIKGFMTSLAEFSRNLKDIWWLVMVVGLLIMGLLFGPSFFNLNINEKTELFVEQVNESYLLGINESISEEIKPVIDDGQEKIGNLFLSAFKPDVQNDDDPPCTPTFKIKNNNLIPIDINIKFSTQNSSESARAGWEKLNIIQMSLTPNEISEITGDIYAPTITHYPYECWIIRESIVIEML